MRTTLVLVAAAALLGCDDGGGGGGGGGGGSGGSGSAPAWSGGPAGHVFVAAGPLYDVDARDGRVLRTLGFDHFGGALQASAAAVFFRMNDAGGNRQLVSLGLDTDTPVPLSDRTSTLLGVAGDTLVGMSNGDVLVLIDLGNGTTSEVPLPPTESVTCSSGSVSGGRLVLSCFRFATVSPDAGLLTFDVAGQSFGTFVTVKAAASTISMASNVTETPAGVLFSLYEGGASAGSRTAFLVDPDAGTVSAGVPIPGISDDLDEQAAIGNVVYLSEFPNDQVVPFDVSTMTALAPIAVSKPRHLRTGGGMVWVGSHQEPGALVRIDPATGATAVRAFPALESSQIDSLAYAGD